jgi:hypothetical protein
MNVIFYLMVLPFAWLMSFTSDISMNIKSVQTLDSLGACQGISIQQGNIFAYGDREIGMIRTYQMISDSLQYTGKEIKLTIQGQDLINHPTGLAIHKQDPVFIGNSIRLNTEGTLWKAVIYCVDWKGMQQTGTLDGNLINTIEDDACVQGTRPEYVPYGNNWYVATADYGPKGNEVRLYDPRFLKKASKTSDPSVLFKKFKCGPWVQNLCWIPEKNILVLVQNQIEGRKWRFSFLDLEKSIETGTEVVIKQIDLDKNDELEGFAILPGSLKGLAVSSSRKNNTSLLNIQW